MENITIINVNGVDYEIKDTTVDIAVESANNAATLANAAAETATNTATAAQEAANNATSASTAAQEAANNAASAAATAAEKVLANTGLFKDRTIETEYVYGTINTTTGEASYSTKSSAITPDFLFADVGKVKITSNNSWHGFRAFEYDAEKNFLRCTGQVYKDTYTLSDDCKFFKVSIFKNAGTNIDDISTQAGYVKVTVYGLDYELYGRVYNNAEIKANTEKMIYPQTGELFILPPSEEYPFPTGLTSWGVVRGHLATMYGKWDDLAANYPDYVSSEILGMDASGQYQIKAYTITSNNNKSLHSGNKQLKMLYMSCIHGDEVNCAEEDYLYFKDLLENHETGNNRVLWDNVLFKIIPICNPWGYDNLSRLNSNGVNLNRNFSGNWEYISQETNANDYSGETAMSEAETQIVSTFIKNNSDAFFCFNRHGTEKFTDSGIIGYLASFWNIDAFVYRAMANRVNTAVKSTFEWVTSDKPVNKTRSIFDIQNVTTHAQRWTGTLDSHWTYVYGKHGALIELGFQGNVLGSDYPNGSGNDFMAICIKILSETLVYPVVFNNAIYRSDKRYEI